MNVSNLTIKATIVGLVCLFVKAERIVSGDKNTKNCYRVDLVPNERPAFNMTEIFWLRGEIKYHLFDGNTGSVLVASNASTSYLCMDDDDNDDHCYYLFIHGNGLFSIVNEDDDRNNDNEEEAIVEHGEVYFDEPSMLSFGSCDHYYCNDHDYHSQQQQLIFIGLKDDQPTLYDSNNRVVHSLFRQQELDESVDDDGDNEKKSNEMIEAVIKITCLEPTECYKLVGSSLYVLQKSNGNNNSIVEEEGSTFRNFQTLGDEGECRRSHYCEIKKPLLSETLRGREILEVARSVSNSDALVDIHTPQYKAACWIIYEDAQQLNANAYNIVQRYILALMFYALHGEEWSQGLDFLTPKNECDWNKPTSYWGFFNAGNGVHCNKLGYVLRLELQALDLYGSIPLELSSLFYIEYLDFQMSYLFGSIPSELGTLQHLYYVDFGINALTGSIPESIGEIKNLKFLSLEVNALTGTIPSLVQTDLRVLNLRSNMLTASPDAIWKMTQLEELDLEGNFLSGIIPDDIYDFTSLKRLNLVSTDLTGTLPSKILELPRLASLTLSENSLTGTIPTHVATNSPLVALWLGHNRLTGTIPPSLSLLGNLEVVKLSYNLLSGEIPSNFTNLSSLSSLVTHNNNITGDSPFQNCEQSPWNLRADCNPPRKVYCPCCTYCHGMFKTFMEGLGCSSGGEYTLVLENLRRGHFVEMRIQHIGATHSYTEYDLSETLHAENTTYRHTGCLSMSGCFLLSISYGSGMKLWINNNLVVNEHFLSLQDSDSYGLHYFSFGYDSAGGIIKKDTCDNLMLCNTTFEANSTQRHLVDKLTRITGIQGFNDTSSSFYKAACNWISHFETHDHEDIEEYNYMQLFQYFFLAQFFYDTNGNKWTSSNRWLTTNTSFCDWQGIGCDNYGVVTSIELPSNNLRGTLPAEIAELSGLEYISLGENRISGTLPSGIGTKLTMLNFLNVSFNGLWGSIPAEFSKLSELQEFDASHNQLTGGLPPDIGYLTKLQVLDVFNNTVGGSLPSTFDGLLNLKRLSLGSNLLVGSATRLRGLSNLEVLDLSQNIFSGTVPIDSSQKMLRVLQLSGNQFRGSVPTVVENLSSLEILFLHNNMLTGNLPSHIGNLNNLVLFSVSDNNVKGSIPSHIGKLQNLALVHLQNNRLEGDGDLFDYTVGDYISDCGNTFASPARMKCTSCSVCCEVHGDCISKEITWPGKTIRATRLSARAFVFVTTLAACLFILTCARVFRSAFRATSDFSLYHEFQAQSVYSFFLTNSIWANMFAATTVTIQLVLLSIFLEASDFNSTKNDWNYSMSCPNDNVFCEDNRLISPPAWFAYSYIMLSYLGTDFVESIKMIFLSMLLRSHRKGGFAGFVVLYITICSAVASGLYNYSTGMSNTDILKDAVILLFLNELDERLYSFLKKLMPIWVENRSQEIEADFEKMMKRYTNSSITQGGNLASNNTTQNCGKDEDEQEKSGCNSNSNANDENEKHKQNLGADSTNSRLLVGPHCQVEISRKDKEINPAGTNHYELRLAACDTRMREQRSAILDLKNDLATSTNAHAKSQNDYKELEQKHLNLEQEIYDAKLHFRELINGLKEIVMIKNQDS